MPGLLMQYLLLTFAKSLNGTNCTMSLAATPLRDLNLYKKKKIMKEQWGLNGDWQQHPHETVIYTRIKR